MKKLKRISMLLLAFVMAAGLLVIQPENVSAASSYYVTTKEVSIVKTASKSAYEVLPLPKEAVVKVTSTANSKWYKVVYQNSKQDEYKGYIASSALAKAVSYKTTESCPIRKEQKSESKKVKTVARDKNVFVVNTDGKWYKVVYYCDDENVYRGYIHKSHLKKVTAAKKPAAKAKTYVATCDVNMRQKASADSGVLMVVYEGLKVKVTDTSNSKWYKVSYTNSKGKTYNGYIRSKYLEKK